MFIAAGSPVQQSQMLSLCVIQNTRITSFGSFILEMDTHGHESDDEESDDTADAKTPKRRHHFTQSERLHPFCI